MKMRDYQSLFAIADKNIRIEEQEEIERARLQKIRREKFIKELTEALANSIEELIVNSLGAIRTRRGNLDTTYGLNKYGKITSGSWILDDEKYQVKISFSYYTIMDEKKLNISDSSSDIKGDIKDYADKNYLKELLGEKGIILEWVEYGCNDDIMIITLKREKEIEPEEISIQSGTSIGL